MISQLSCSSTAFDSSLDYGRAYKEGKKINWKDTVRALGRYYLQKKLPAVPYPAIRP